MEPFATITMYNGTRFVHLMDSAGRLPERVYKISRNIAMNLSERVHFPVFAVTSASMQYESDTTTEETTPETERSESADIRLQGVDDEIELRRMDGRIGLIAAESQIEPDDGEQDDMVEQHQTDDIDTPTTDILHNEAAAPRYMRQNGPRYAEYRSWIGMDELDMQLNLDLIVGRHIYPPPDAQYSIFPTIERSDAEREASRGPIVRFLRRPPYEKYCPYTFDEADVYARRAIPRHVAFYNGFTTLNESRIIPMTLGFFMNDHFFECTPAPARVLSFDRLANGMVRISYRMLCLPLEFENLDSESSMRDIEGCIEVGFLNDHIEFASPLLDKNSDLLPNLRILWDEVLRFDLIDASLHDEERERPRRFTSVSANEEFAMYITAEFTRRCSFSTFTSSRLTEDCFTWPVSLYAHEQHRDFEFGGRTLPHLDNYYPSIPGDRGCMHQEHAYRGNPRWTCVSPSRPPLFFPRYMTQFNACSKEDDIIAVCPVFIDRGKAYECSPVAAVIKRRSCETIYGAHVTKLEFMVISDPVECMDPLANIATSPLKGMFKGRKFKSVVHTGECLIAPVPIRVASDTPLQYMRRRRRIAIVFNIPVQHNIFVSENMRHGEPGAEGIASVMEHYISFHRSARFYSRRFSTFEPIHFGQTENTFITSMALGIVSEDDSESLSSTDTESSLETDAHGNETQVGLTLSRIRKRKRQSVDARLCEENMMESPDVAFRVLHCNPGIHTRQRFYSRK
jgi:hypothetical protein